MRQLVTTDPEDGEKVFFGAGESSEGGYKTWMILQCPVCGQLIKESYEAKMVTREEADAELRHAN